MDQQTQVIAKQQAHQITLRSAPCDPENGHDIHSKSLLQRALLFAELSMIAYLKPEETEKAALRLGFTETTFYNNDGSQAYYFANKQDIVIVFVEQNQTNGMI